MSTQVSNPFGGEAQSVAVTDTLAASESDRAIQEVQAAMVIAKKFPRQTIEAMDRILNACTRPTLAATALYSYPRGGQEVTGPSIRLAEAIAQEWGNLQFGIRELSNDNGNSTVEAFAWDVQTNTRQVKVFRVPHERHTRRGVTVLTDPRDIYELIANQGARRLRACILGVIPGDVVEKAVEQCSVTQQANIDTSPEKIKAMVEHFASRYNVPEELIAKRLGKRTEAIQPAQMQQLHNIASSLKDGMSKPSDWFDIDDPAVIVGAPTSDLTAKLQAPAEDKPVPAKKAPAKAKESE